LILKWGIFLDEWENRMKMRLIQATLTAGLLVPAYAGATTRLFYADDASSTGNDSLYTSGVTAPVSGPSGATVVRSPLPKSASNVSSPTDVGVSGNTLFYSDSTTDRIYTVPVGGPFPSVAPTPIIDFSATAATTIFSLAVNNAGTQLYYTEANTDGIWRASTNGTGNTQLLNITSITGYNTYSSNPSPRGLALNEGTSTLYFGDTITDYVYSANLNGTGGATLIDGRASFATNANVTISSIAVDSVLGKLYISEQSFDRIWSANLDGSSVTLVANLTTLGLGANFTPEDIELYNGRLYVSDSSFDGIFSIDPLSLDADRDVLTHVTGYNIKGLAVVPEPTSLGVIALGAVGLLARRRKRSA